MKQQFFKKSRKLLGFLLIIFAFTVIFSLSGSAVMSEKEVKSRLSSYTDGKVTVQESKIYITHNNLDAEDEEIMSALLDISQRLMGTPVEDYCEVYAVFGFTDEPFDKDFSLFADKMCKTQQILSSFWCDWSRYNKLTVNMYSYGSSNYSYTASFCLKLGGSEKDEKGESYDNKLLSVISEASKSCKTQKDYVQYYLKWIDENSRYSYFYTGTNDPYHTLLDGKGVCGSFANTFKDLCNASGIPALLVFNAEENHAWNEVYADGKWYSADLCDIVHSKSGVTSGYLFTDPDMPKDNNSFIEKYKKYYVNSFSSKSVDSAKTVLPKTAVTFTASDSAVRLNWKKVNSAKGYYIKMYNSESGKYETVKAVSGTTTYRIENLKPGTKYKFCVIPYTTVSGKTYTASAAKITVLTKPAKVSANKASSVTSSSLKLSWKKVSSAAEYEVLKSSDKKEWTKIKTLTQNSYTVKNLDANTKYYFKIRAVNSTGKGTASSCIAVKTKLDKTAFTLSSKGGKVTVKWKEVDGADGYAVYYSTSKDMSGAKKILVKNSKVLEKTLSSLEIKTKYYFRVRAFETVKGERIYAEPSAVKAVKVK